MNLLECYVTKVIGEPYFKYDKWWQKVEYICYGLTDVTDIIIEENQVIEIDYMFLN